MTVPVRPGAVGGKQWGMQSVPGVSGDGGEGVNAKD